MKEVMPTGNSYTLAGARAHEVVKCAIMSRTKV